MTTTSTISTKTFPSTISLRCILGASCLLAMVSGCTTPQVAGTSMSIDLNNYQTAHILKPGTAALQMSFFTITPALTSTKGIQGSNFHHNAAYSGGLVFEAGIEENLQIGMGGQFGICPKIEDTGLNGNVGANFFTKFALGDHKESVVQTSLFGDFAYQIGDKSSAQYNVSTYFDSTIISRGAFGDYRMGATIPDSLIRWNIGSQAFRVTMALPISIQALGSSVSYNIRPALHYFHYTISGQEIISRKRTNYETGNSISMQRNYLIPSLSFGYSIQDKVTSADWLSFELTYALWDNIHTLAAGWIFRIPIQLSNRQ